LLQFRRRATQLGQLEDWFIFNGTYPSINFSANAIDAFAKERRPGFRTTVQSPLSGSPDPQRMGPYEWHPKADRGTLDQRLQKEGMRQRNPGSLGLIEAPRVEREHIYTKQAEQVRQDGSKRAAQSLRARSERAPEPTSPQLADNAGSEPTTPGSKPTSPAAATSPAGKPRAGSPAKAEEAMRPEGSRQEAGKAQESKERGAQRAMPDLRLAA
jgi:hypothetical protein